MAEEGPVYRTDAEMHLRSTRAQLALRLDWLASGAAVSPLTSLLLLAGANAFLALLFVGVGAAAGDQALLFRELMPGTWLSFAQLMFIAFVGWSIHLAARPEAAWHRDFWGLSAAVFVLFAADEITQLSQFLGTWLNEGAGLSPAEGFNDLGAVILTLLFGGAALLLLPRALVLLRHPLALSLMAIGVLLGAASQGLDSFVTPTSWEFVAEETFKMAAEVFFIGGFLAALRGTLARR